MSAAAAVATGAAVVVTLVAAAPAAGQAALAADAPAGRDLAPAPYVAPAVGTRYVYRNLEQTVTGNAGLRTTFTDADGRAGARLALFLADHPQRPLTVDSGALAQVWPLRVGRRARLTASRGPLRWAYDLRVVGTERAAVPAGQFDTYVVELVETAVVTRNPTLPPRVTVFWYAPAVGAVVRFSTGRLAEGVTPAPRSRQELVRIERP